MKTIEANLKSHSNYRLTNEINILKAIRHENIVELLNVFVIRKTELSSKMIVLTFSPAEQDLYRYIRSQKDLFEENSILRIIYKILKGLDHIHDLSIIHRDIKAENILIFNGLKVKICDFGLAYQPGQHKRTRRGTKVYCAPEMLLDVYNYDTKVDIWVNFGKLSILQGVGCILADFMTLSTYFNGHRTHRQQLQYILEKVGKPDDWPELAEQEPNLAKIK